ncbi:hypothetical protein E1B28_005043 [Marasmius oreades]|uniref:Uncharacterized protein n=1 Tax=Marasmius oreades TaxID=181124 RepID=A0A9P7UZT4_9AGAR|nr:uncharacterized protein E1B28_005043 [Marasmius oreades]KAG7097720.1 hypothetical protein E1B28_005043 [Marasmius oreades]
MTLFCDNCESDVDECIHHPSQQTEERTPPRTGREHSTKNPLINPTSGANKKRRTIGGGQNRQYSAPDTPSHRKGPSSRNQEDENSPARSRASPTPTSSLVLAPYTPNRDNTPTHMPNNPQKLTQGPPAPSKPGDYNMLDGTAQSQSTPRPILSLEDFTSIPPFKAQEFPYRNTPALSLNNLPDNIKLEGLSGAMLNTGNFPRFVVAKEQLMKNIPPSQLAYLKLDDPSTLAIFFFGGGSQLFEAAPNILSATVASKIQNLIPVENVHIIRPYARDHRIAARNKYGPSCFGFVTTDNEDFSRALASIQTLIYDETLAFHMIRVADTQFSWIVGVYECQQFPDDGTDRMRDLFRYGMYTSLIKDEKFRNETNIAMPNDTRSLDERVFEQLLSIDARFTSCDNGGKKRWLVSMCPCTDNYQHWHMLRDIVRNKDYLGGPYLFTLWEAYKNRRPSDARTAGPKSGGTSLIDKIENKNCSAAEAWKKIIDRPCNQKDNVEQASGWESEEFLEKEDKKLSRTQPTPDNRNRGRGRAGRRGRKF